ncbi:uncharacterized protein [Garra rufa]|uniref:uncharacterized protein n=1 Tax=Garra rufa TaxID=137080 RepID=UPI003CCEE288
MDDPNVFIILLKQGNRSLEDHTRDFVFYAPFTHYPDSCLCTFYRAGLNIAAKSQLSGEGPRESIADYIEWVLASCGSTWTIGIVKEDVSPTHDPESSQTSPQHAEYEPERTANEGLEPRATEPESSPADQVREPASTSAMVDCDVEQVRKMESPAHCNTVGGEMDNSGDLIDFFSEVVEENSCDLIDFFSEPLTCLNLPPTRPLLSGSAWSLLVPPSRPESPLVPSSRPESLTSPVSPLAHPQPTICAVGCGPTTALNALSSTVARRSTSYTGLRPGQSSSLRHLRTLLLRLCLVTPSHRLLRTPPSLRHSLHPLSLRLRPGPPELRLRLGRQSL